MKYHEKLRFLNKSYFNKIYIVLVLSFTFMTFDILIVLIISTVQVELLKLEFNFDEYKNLFSSSLRDCQQVTFVTPSGFCP